MDIKILVLVLVIIILIVVKLMPSASCLENYKYFYNPSGIEKARIRNSPPLYFVSGQQLIPKKIIQTAGSDVLDISIYHTCNQNKYMNPDYEYIFFDNQSCDAFIKEHYPEYLDDYNKIIPGAFKADLFRYLVLYKTGGVYVDCKSAVIEPLGEFISADDSVVLVRDLEKSYIYNGLIASVPGNAVIKAYIDKYINNIRSGSYGKNVFDIGGPSMCGAVFNELIGKPVESSIELGKYIIDGTKVNVSSFIDFSSTTSVIRRSDGKVLFNRAPSNYMLRKLKDVVMLKDYGTRWFLRIVYKK